MSVIICYKVQGLQKCQCLEEEKTISFLLGHYAPGSSALLLHFHPISLVLLLRECAILEGSTSMPFHLTKVWASVASKEPMFFP